jgi:D-3-phosphoglycerate dehydrogenase
MRVLIPQPIAAEGKMFLQEHNYELVCPNAFEREDMLRDIADCEAVLLRTAIVDKEILAAGRKLRIIARHGAGFDNVDIATAAAYGIWVTNAPMSTTSSVGEFTITAMLLLAKRVPFFIKGLQEGNFAVRMQHSGIELENKSLGIIGLGRIGSEVAKKAINGFDMKVMAYDPLCSPEKVPPGVELCRDISLVLSASDFITLHMPNIPETKKMFSHLQFSAMKKTAFFINCARGEIVDEDALVKALKDGTIAGAAIDVYSPEPPSMDNPLFHLENVIATPHIASNTVEANVKMALHAAMEIHRVLSGEKPLWPVNKPLGKFV